jgi:hypothetical protein
MEERNPIGELLVEYGYVTQEDVQTALSEQDSYGGKLGEILVRMEKVSSQDIEWVLSKQLDIPFIIVDESVANIDLIKLFPKDFLMINRIIPMYETDDELAIVTDDPSNTKAFQSIEKKFGKQITISAGNGDAIDEMLQKVFRQDGAPDIISHLEQIFERLKDTCLYRLDFILRDSNYTINAYGFGITKKVFESEMPFKKEDVFSALTTMNINYLFDEYINDTGSIVSLYPMTEPFEPMAYPAVYGNFGLALNEDIMFADTAAAGLENMYYSSNPVDGYEFIATKKGCARKEKTIFTLDSAPQDFSNCFVKASIPAECPSCSGAGCDVCKYLGLVFKNINGIYSYSDIIRIMKEG